MIDNNTVNKIVIARQRIGIEDKFVALIYQNTDDSSRPKRLTLGNVDSFLETLEKQQLKNVLLSKIYITKKKYSICREKLQKVSYQFLTGIRKK